MAIGSCPICAKRLRIREELIGKRGKCPGCQNFFSVRVGSATGTKTQTPAIQLIPEEPEESLEETSATEDLFRLKAKWDAFHARFLTLEWPFGRRHLRRCIQCNAKQFTVIEPCVYCESPTVGLDLLAVYNGTNGMLLRAAKAYRKSKRNSRRLGVLIWAFTCLAIAIALIVKFWLGLLIGLIFIPAAFVFHISLLMALRSLFFHRYPPDTLENEREPALRQKLESLSEEIVNPFLARNGIGEGNRVRVPPEEVSMLIDLFYREGFQEIEGGSWEEVLIGCALRRDFQLFSKRIAYFENADPISVYASLYPDQRYDATYLPFLREYLAQQGQMTTFDEIALAIEERRQEYKLNALSKDLEQRRRGQALNITIEQIDAMNPYNFELFLGMIYQSQGYAVTETPKAGDQGADVFVEIAGERTVIQAKLYNQPVGNHAVQEAIAARTHFRCHHAQVVTNNGFTRSAIELAGTSDVRLIDRPQLIDMLERFNKSPKDYNRLPLLMQPAVRTAESVLEAVVVA